MTQESTPQPNLVEQSTTPVPIPTVPEVLVPTPTPKKSRLAPKKSRLAPTSKAKKALSSTRSEATKRSWADKAVAARRATRTAVIVKGHGEFGSVSKAFNALNLPKAGRVRFRVALKKEGTQKYVYEGTTYHFAAVKGK